MSIAPFQTMTSTGVSGGRITLTRPPTQASLPFTLSTDGVMGTEENENATGVLIVETDLMPRPGEILLAAATSTMTQGNNHIAHVSIAQPGTWSGDEDQVVYGTIMYVEETGEEDRWVVTYQKDGVQCPRNLWKGLYNMSLPPETVLGLSLGADGLIAWIDNEPITSGTPLTGMRVPETKAVFTLHRRAHPSDEVVQVARFYY